MLTRLEADGFKNLLDFEADFGPYTCIAGPNAVGKSNIFDAIEFFSLLSEKTFMEAALELRSSGQRGGDPSSLFWKDPSGDYSDMRLGAEMLVPLQVEDDFGRIARPTTTFLKYEIVLRYVPPESGAFTRFGRIMLMSESLTHITKSSASHHMPWRHNAAVFRNAVVQGRRSGVAYISTRVDDDSSVVVEVHQDGGSRGKARPSPADRAPRTIVATTTTADDPTILAARREMQSWRKLALEPSAMRTPDSLNDVAQVSADGAHLASALYRLALEEGTQAYAQIAATASALVDVREVSVDVDQQRDQLTLQARVSSDPLLPARALSDGTLRFLALCIILSDPVYEGVICMEEPENGIHPARISAMVDLLRDLSVDPTRAPGDDNPFRQVIVNTHSPYFVVLQKSEELLLATTASVKRQGRAVRTLRLLPMRDTWRSGRQGFAGSLASIVDYLRFPPEAEQQLDWPLRQVELH